MFGVLFAAFALIVCLIGLGLNIKQGNKKSALVMTVCVVCNIVSLSIQTFLFINY